LIAATFPPFLQSSLELVPLNQLISLKYYSLKKQGNTSFRLLLPCVCIVSPQTTLSLASPNCCLTKTPKVNNQNNYPFHPRLSRPGSDLITW